MTHSGLRTDLGAEFAAETQAAQYPYILIPKVGRELPLLLEGLMKGELPIVVNHEGKLIAVGSCAKSAIEMNKLRRVYNYSVVLSPTDTRPVTTIESIMEVLPWMLS